MNDDAALFLDGGQRRRQSCVQVSVLVDGEPVVRFWWRKGVLRPIFMAPFNDNIIMRRRLKKIRAEMVVLVDLATKIAVRGVC